MAGTLFLLFLCPSQPWDCMPVQSPFRFFPKDRVGIGRAEISKVATVPHSFLISQRPEEPRTKGGSQVRGAPAGLCFQLPFLV